MYMSNSLVIVFTTALVIIASVESARKCSGRWAIHACYGGNGKRSNPPPSVENRQQLKDRQFILNQLLFGDARPQMDSIDLTDNAGYTDTDDLYPSSEDYANELSREKNLLRYLLLDRKLQTPSDDNLPFIRK